MSKTAKQQVAEKVTTAHGVERDETAVARPTDELPSLLDDPVTFMRHFEDEISQLLPDFGFGRKWWALPLSRIRVPRALREMTTASWSPEIEILEREGMYCVRIDLPGVQKGDVTITAFADYVTIQGERKHEDKETKESLVRSERSYGKFYRSVPLPRGAHAEKVTATFKDGVLEIAVDAPKCEESTGRHVRIHSA